MTDTPTITEPDWLLAQEVIKGYTLRAFRLPYGDTILEFVQVTHPDDTVSYFRRAADGWVEPGPFGGGYCWTVPKYIVRATARFFNKIFPPATEETQETPA